MLPTANFHMRDVRLSSTDERDLLTVVIHTEMSSAKKTKYHNPLQPKAEVNVHQFLDPYRTVPNSFKVSSS